MGRRSQERRAAKQRTEQDRARRRAAAGPGVQGRRGGGTWRGGLGSQLRLFLASAAMAAAEDPLAGKESAAVLAEAAADLGHLAVGMAVASVTEEVLASVWEGGWQPAEVTRAVRRRRSPRHEALVRTAVAASASAAGSGDRSPPVPWQAQLEALGATTRWWGPGADWLGPLALRDGLAYEEALAVAVESLGVLYALPALERLLPVPSEWGRAGSEQLFDLPDDHPGLAKVRALLAKAESTSFPAEAEALTAKAQELMARYAIDEALAASRGERRDRPRSRRVAVDDPYAAAKSHLLHVVAEANRVRSVWRPEWAMMSLVGFEGDLDAVELLYTSLLVQGSRAMLARGSVVDGHGRSRTRSFRQSFLLSFAGRIGERLTEAAAHAEREAEAELGGALLPVLAGRRDEVEHEVEVLFPRLQRVRGPAVTNREGWVAGRVAAERATLGPDAAQLPGIAT